VVQGVKKKVTTHRTGNQICRVTPATKEGEPEKVPTGHQVGVCPSKAGGRGKIPRAKS